MHYFEMVSPRSVGIAPEGIDNFLSAAARAGLELHRLMILRRGKCCAKICWAPYGEEDLHPLYSFSKSLTATAIGFAWQEGFLSLDEKIVDIFPEDLPADPNEHLLACTIHHLLCMSCGQETESLDRSASWRKSFFAHPFLHAPGTFYKYNTCGTNLLACIIRKKTGMQVTEYLKDRLFKPLGIADVYCAKLPDDLETEFGGAGMKMRLEDMAKFTQFMLQDGTWAGKSLLKDWYFARAGKKQIETAHDSEGHVFDWAQGYGYQCWMNTFPDSFRADGAFGQFGLVYPVLDLCIIINAATEQTQTLLDVLNLHLLPAVSTDTPEKMASPAEHPSNPLHPSNTETTQENMTCEKAADEPFSAQACQNFRIRGAKTVFLDADTPWLEQRTLLVSRSCRNPTFEKILEHSLYQAEDPAAMDGIERLVGGAGLFNFPATAHISAMRFSFTDGMLRLFLTEDAMQKELQASVEYSPVGLAMAAPNTLRALAEEESKILRPEDGYRWFRLELGENSDGFSMDCVADLSLLGAA